MFLKSILKYYYHRWYRKFHYDTFKTLCALGKLHAENNKLKRDIKNFGEIEFQVFSQRGEDGIIQYIINNIEIKNKIFIEFGVENYTESNTRFLLINNNWSGLVIDGSKTNIRFIKNDFIYWKYDIVAVNSFITKENINNIIGNYTSYEDIGLLSLDIDGNDYWIWDSITVIRPRIVVCEYNSTFGSEEAVTVPYKSEFVRREGHYSDLYFGASLAAFCHLAEKKGYDFIGTASTGVNAFFIRNDIKHSFKKLNSVEGFNESPNRDSRNLAGKLSFLRHNERLQVIEDLPVFDIFNNKIALIKDIYK